jgi:TRAP-type C4-dicarboxylate transport system substrate-binding protein
MKLTTARVAAIIAAAAGFILATHSAEAQKPKPVIIRLVADHPPPPHPAAISQNLFKKKIEETIPGSEVRLFFAGGLYTVPEAMEAMAEGNVEMTWGQFGKTAASDRWMNVVAGPMLLTTPGAIEKFDSLDTVKMLKARFAKEHGIQVFGTSHMSMYMGAGSGKRLLGPDDFKGRKIRSMGPAENAMLSAWGSSPVTMAFGEVPPALQTGVLDGLLTSLGGFNSVRNQAPFFTVAGVNGIVGDYYWVGASQKWWAKLDKVTQDAVEKIIVEYLIPVSKEVNWCNDQRLLTQLKTDDPEKPGIYVLKPDQTKVLASALGDATQKWVKANTPADAHKWVDTFAKEAKAASAANPIGSSALEKTDCSKYADLFPKPKK